MNSEICSASVAAVPADDGPLAGTTVDPWIVSKINWTPGMSDWTARVQET